MIKAVVDANNTMGFIITVLKASPDWFAVSDPFNAKAFILKRGKLLLLIAIVLQELSRWRYAFSTHAIWDCCLLAIYNPIHR